MTDKHTPGPWVSKEGTSTGRVVVAPNEPKVRKNVASVGGQNRDGNARLIAAAPDMLEALRNLRACIMETRGKDANDACDAADAAIAKAEGRS